MNIVYSTNPLIREISKPVEKFDEKLQILSDNMFVKMKESEGIGLSAIQIGKPIRMFVIDISKKEVDKKKDSEKTENFDYIDHGKFCMINPKITWKSDEEIIDEEGCLSCPGVRAEVPRHERIEAEYFNEKGEKKSVKASGLLSVCIQHENDHLNGILFIDYLSKIKQDMLFKKIAKKLKQDEEV